MARRPFFIVFFINSEYVMQGVISRHEVAGNYLLASFINDKRVARCNEIHDESDLPQFISHVCNIY